MIGEKDKILMKEVLEMALEEGASDARATLSKSSENLVATLDGEVDKVTRCEDRSLYLELFADGRFGSFSTNRLDTESLGDFVRRALDTVRMLAPDRFRRLPDRSRCCTGAVTGDECGIFDTHIWEMTPELRCSTALDASIFGTDDRIISEEGEYSDCECCTYVTDTQGLECLHRETSFDYGVELTVQDAEGDRYSGYWWHSSPFGDRLEWRDCGRKALERALGQFGSDAVPGGRYNMVVDSEVASKMVSPILNALSGYSIQQNNSFLMDSLGRKLFPEGMTVMDMPHIPGQSGSKLFDSEGVATTEMPVIKDGVVQTYFINTYMSGKLDLAPTIESAVRAKVLPWPRKGLDQGGIMKMCGSGILVTEFNGGNCNSATGDFSYGIEGFLFEDGKAVRPVSGMLVTGNYLRLWQGLLAAGDDARSCMSKLIPTLAFSGVDFSG